MIKFIKVILGLILLGFAFVIVFIGMFFSWLLGILK